MKFIARHKKTLKEVEMEFVSLKQAMYFNPDCCDFRRIE